MPKSFAGNSCRKKSPRIFPRLEIPLTVIATDLHRRQEAALTSGPLHPALAASMAIPGLFRPVAIGEAILVDGGATNPAAVRPAARRRRHYCGGRCIRQPGYDAERLAGRLGQHVHGLAHHGFDNRRRQAQARRTRPRDQAQHRDFPHARLLSGERHPAHRRHGEGRCERRSSSRCWPDVTGARGRTP